MNIAFRMLSTAAALAFVASGVYAASLTSVGVLDPDFPFSRVRAVTVGPDGTVYAVGDSRSDTWTVFSGTQSPDHPFIWTSAHGLLELFNPSGEASEARGVDVRLGQGTDGVDQILVGGRIGQISRFYKADVTDLVGGAWSTLQSPLWDPGGNLAYRPQNFRPGEYNQIRVVQESSGVAVAGETWYMPYRLESDGNKFGRWRGDPQNEFDTGTTGPVSMGGVSVNGRVVGTDRVPPRARRAVYMVPPSSPAEIPGGNILRSEGFGISGNGQWLSGLDYSDTANVVFQAFVWEFGSPSMTLLGQHGPCDTRSVAYAVSNSGIAVGQSWNPGDGEVAVVWDSTGLWDATGQARRLTDLLSGNGVDTSAWTKLTRALSVSDDGMVIGGWGQWAADGSTRGFVITLSEPLAPVPLPVLGACCVNEGPNAGTCSVGTAADCASTPFGVYLGDDVCCDACPGACCNLNATCTIEFAGDCEANDGLFRGVLSHCGQEAVCEGACCLGFEVCEEATYGACEGDFAGIGVDCEDAACPCTTSNRLWADADRDGDVDHDDYAVFQTCYTGPGGGVPPGCECLERDGLDDISGVDFEAFKDCVTGPGVPYDINSLPQGCLP